MTAGGYGSTNAIRHKTKKTRIQLVALTGIEPVF
jgi:hypothetical protein